MTNNGNEPAMPITGISFDHRENQYTGDVQAYGLTKREYFAAMAMQGWLASFAGNSGSPIPERTAEFSVELADALLSALASTEQR